MIKTYLAFLPSLYEGEDIEIEYSIYKDDEHIKKERVFLEYVKPAVVGLTAVMKTLDVLKEYRREKIVIIINDAALNELLKGIVTTKNGDVIKMSGRTKRQMEKFDDLSFINVTKNKQSLIEWKENVSL